jgi:4'-phosphopantetheinyl transferase
MPIILRENINNGVIGVWKIAESIDDLQLLVRLTERDSAVFNEIRAPHRKKEWLTARVLLNELTGDQIRIGYHNDGRPFAENSIFNISISHTSIYVSVFLHYNAIPGIDIELVTRQVGRVATRFLSPDELSNCLDDTELSNSRLLMHWCAKEAIFKMIPLSEIEFATDIKINYYGPPSDTGTFQGSFESENGSIPISIYYRILDELLIVWGWIEKEEFDKYD